MLHHVVDPLAFLTRQVALVRSGGGVVVACDHSTDPNPDIAAHHNALEIARDRTHTRNLTSGELVDLLARVGLNEIRLVEDSFTLDFDEWFDRGTPGDTKDAVRGKLLGGPVSRSFRPTVMGDGSIRIDGVRTIVRGLKS